MKIAVSGTHSTGKTTLIDHLSNILPGYQAMDEPYYSLLEQGYEFYDLPRIEDYEKQLELCLEQISESDDNTIFDRCPLDFLAYIKAHEESYLFNRDEWEKEIKDAMEKLDLIIFVPVEIPDRIDCCYSEQLDLREKVNTELQDLIYDYQLSSNAKILEVTGTVKERISKILPLFSHNETVE